MQEASTVAFSQRRQYTMTRSMLQPRRLVVLMDFTGIPTLDKPGATLYIQDCILVLEYFNDRNQRERRNFDFLCSHQETNKHDYHFVLQVWVWLFLHLKFADRFDRIDIWSDGGPHHFKTRYCQFMWHVLSMLRFSNRPIHHHFFASYHGHSMADGHAATVKKCLLTRYLLTELERTTASPTASFGPRTIEDVADLIRANCENTQVIVFNQIDRDEERKPQVKNVPLIKSNHEFIYRDGKCSMKERTNYAGLQEFTFY
jgi:hypothetical protein